MMSGRMVRFSRNAGNPVGIRVMGIRKGDRRRHARVRAHVCSWLQFQDDPVPWGMVCLDLSEEGAQFSAVRPMAFGASVLIHLQLEPFAGTLECKAKVCWTTLMSNGLYHFGIRFMDLSQGERDDLSRLVAERQRTAVFAAV